MRKKGENPLILDAGDMFFSKTNISSNIKSEKFRCSTMLQGYEKIGCDALNIGKYELLAGVSFLKDMETKYKSIPFISANIKYKDTGELLFKPYVISERDGLRLGIIGLSNMVPDTMTNIIMDDYIKTGNTFIKNLKNQVDLIILLVNTDRNSQSSLTKNFDEADIDRYDKVMESGNPDAAYFAVQALAAKYNDGVGVDGQLLTGKPAKAQGDEFRSQAEVVRAMSDPRYDRDPAYRQDVYDKLERSNLQF